ncbi:hypothetical protein Tco_0167236 [Tanacetum coccineum]
MHQFWNTITKVKDSSSYQFKLDNKKFRVNAEVFHEILQIYPKLPDQPFDIPPSTNEEIMSFIYELGYTVNIKTIPELVVDHMHQPWRTFAAVINRCISRKTTRLDKLRLARAQILWGMYHCNNVDFVELLWEDFAFQIDNHYSKESMPYPRFTKIIINHFISQNKSISLRNMINLHTARDDSLLGTLKYVSKIEEYQVYGALIPKEMLNEDILNSTAYHTYYAYASGAKELKKTRKFKKHASPKLKTIPVSPKEPTMKSAKKPEPVKKNKALAKGNGTDFESGVLNKQQRKISGIDEGTGTKLGVPDLPKYDSESEKGSWGDSGEEEDDDEDDTEDESDNDVNDDDGEEEESERVFTPPEFVATNDEEKIDDEENMDEEDDDDVMKELYKEVNVNLGSKDVDMTDADQGRADHHNVSQELGFEQVEEDAYVTLQTYL